MFQGFKKATPYGGARKLRLTLPPVRRVSPTFTWTLLSKKIESVLYAARSTIFVFEISCYWQQWILFF